MNHNDWQVINTLCFYGIVEAIKRIPWIFGSLFFQRSIILSSIFSSNI